MAVVHMLEYSKSSRAKCHGPLPCRGSNIEYGTLRYGRITFGEYGETVRWRHWGCVTPDILRGLAIVSFEDIPGFTKLRTQDQTRVRTAIAKRHVDPADVPSSVKAGAQTVGPAHARKPTQVKRKADEAFGNASSRAYVPSLSQALTSHDDAVRRYQVIDVDANEEDAEAEEEPSFDELYCIYHAKVVGIQYYTGLVGPGEEVTLVREPNNSYDSNAIRVVNIAGNQVGHVPRDVAARLARLLDRRQVSVEATMHEGKLSTARTIYSLQMSIKIYGPSDKRAELEPLLAWATPGGRGFPPPRPDGTRDIPGQVPRTYNIPSISSLDLSGEPATSQLTRAGLSEEGIRQLQTRAAQLEALRKAAELNTMLASLEKVDDESRRNSLLDNLCTKEDVLDIPEHSKPPSIATGELNVNLLRHQSQALQWCLEREYPKLPSKETDMPVQFWQVKKAGNRPYYYNIATKTPQENMPLLGRGALFADSMGLGKTLTMLALVLATKGDVPTEYSKSTLIIVPLSVLSNWETQIKEHLQPDALKHYVYYGAARSIAAQQLKRYDVVITTYQVVTKEHADYEAMATIPGTAKRMKKGSGALLDVQWKRVILDEGHNIRNSRTKMAKAVCALSTQRRWVMSGTPIINSPSDLGSLLSFLQICKPLDNEDYFKRLLIRPLNHGSAEGCQLLKVLMNQICIRRTKEMQDSSGKPLVPLPGVEMITIPVQLEPKTRELYDVLESLSKQHFQRYIDEGGITAAPTNMLSILTRLRQVVLHPALIPKNYAEQLRADLEDGVKTGKQIEITPKLKARLQSILVQAIEDNEECPICFDILNNPRITPCAHIFCLACLTELILRNPKCPMDRRDLSLANLVDPPPPTDLTQAPFPGDEDDENQELHDASSAKIDQLIHLLQLTPTNEKSLVFSQFTTFLDKVIHCDLYTAVTFINQEGLAKIAEELDKAGILHVRFDGKMSARSRQETLERFSRPIEDEFGFGSPKFSSQPDSSSPSTSPILRRKGHSIVLDEDDDGAEDEEKDNDSDFEIDSMADSDDEILEKSPDDRSWIKKIKSKKVNKGKAPMTRKPLASTAFSGTNPKVMLISLKAGALGLNLTVANNVYLVDPWWQEGIESQAIDRCNRIGQTKKVHVYQLIAEDTVEAKVVEIQEKKKMLIKEAFSGMRSTETQRQKREARLQDLIELFGMRQREATRPKAQT